MDRKKLEELYELSEEETGALYDFENRLDRKIKGFYSTNLEKSPNGVEGIEEYSGDFVSEHELLEYLETAEEALKFAQARIGQLTNVVHSFENYDLDDFMVYVDEHSPEWIYTLLEQQMDDFKNYEKSVRDRLVLLDDEPGLEYSFDSDFEIPSNEIDEWGWPREEIWPFE